jgi:serine protease
MQLRRHRAPSLHTLLALAGPVFAVAVGLLLTSASESLAAQETGGPPYVPGEVVVRYQGGAPAKVVDVPAGESVRETASQLRDDPNVDYAVPNYIARAGAFPNDPAFPLQWNFWGPTGIDLPQAWQLASQRGAPGGRGVVVAVLDTGVAYRTVGPYRRAPDLGAVVRGYDFVDRDRAPLDLNGHGTHVAGTIAEATNNGRAATGIAYKAKIMPVRTLDVWGAGDAVTVSRGIRYAVRHHANVINMSLEFPAFVNAREIPQVMSAIRYAHKHRVVMTAVAGNESSPSIVPFPGRARDVISVAATTQHGCRATYSNAGASVDVAAPGGGRDAGPGANAWDAAHCNPAADGPSIYQQTFSTDLDHFALPAGYYGTSMASPHVAGLAALIIGSRRLGRHPSPDAVQRQIEHTAKDIGAPGPDTSYGYGLIDAAAALR